MAGRVGLRDASHGTSIFRLLPGHAAVGLMLRRLGHLGWSIPVTSENEIRVMRHQLFLEALRHREQEVFRYLAILGPALGGYVWLATKYPKDISPATFCLAAIALQGLLLLGAWYSAALGYNYRCITLQLSKEEKSLSVADTVLKAWSDEPGGWGDRTMLGHYFHWARRWPWLGNQAWCFPPELVSVFWWAFLMCNAFLTLATLLICDWGWPVVLTISCGAVAFLLSLIGPRHFGKKLRSVRDKETAEVGTTPGAEPSRAQGSIGD